MKPNNTHEESRADKQSRPEKGRRARFVIFLLLVIILGFAGGYVIRVYFTSAEGDGSASASTSASGPLAGLKEQWREHRLPLDLASLSQLIKDMRSDLENEKMPQLKGKLEDLKAQIDEKRQNAKPELEQEWNKISEKVDGLLSTIKDKREDWAERISEIQEEAQALLEQETHRTEGSSPTPTPNP